MDDYLMPNLNDSRNEWCERLVYILVPHINEGIRSIFNESFKMCVDNNEPLKYLMTFQNLLSKIPQWNSVIIQEEVQRIINKSGCNYINDLITCVHIIQLKVLTCIRVGNKQKKIDISIPKLDHFIHNVYIHVARKIYANVYLFEKNPVISPLQMQKNNREIDLIIRECILTTIRDSIPTEQIVRAYLDESVEHEEEVIIENLEEPSVSGGNNLYENENEKKDQNNLEQSKPVIESLPPPPPPPPIVPIISNVDDNDEPIATLKFNNIDYIVDDKGNETTKNAPKNLERLEEISISNSIKRKLEEEERDEEENNANDKIKIHDDNVYLGNIDVFDINNIDKESPVEMNKKKNQTIPLLDIEELF
jgi:hypothetical protein